MLVFIIKPYCCCFFFFSLQTYVTFSVTFNYYTVTPSKQLEQQYVFQRNGESLSYHASFHSVTDIYIFAIGAELFDDDLQPLTAGTGGQHYFRMKDIKNLQETFDEIIGKSYLKVRSDG